MLKGARQGRTERAYQKGYGRDGGRSIASFSAGCRHGRSFEASSRASLAARWLSGELKEVRGSRAVELEVGVLVREQGERSPRAVSRVGIPADRGVRLGELLLEPTVRAPVGFAGRNCSLEQRRAFLRKTE